MSRENLLMHSLSQFYKVKKNINKLLPIVNQNSKVSLRLLDWFVTNYAKKNKTNYKVNEVNFSVYNNYKSQLKSYSKKQFDPFCRRERIRFVYDKEKIIETTVGQLCFFRWAIQNNIIEFVEDNFGKIENDMISSLKKAPVETPRDGIIKKRSPLSENASKTYTKTHEKIIITFD